MAQYTGKVWVLGDDIDTDIIIPTEYLALKTIEDMKQYGFSPLRPELAGQIQPGDIIVLAGKGHEDYQEIKGKKYPMDERVLIREILEEDAKKKA